MTLLEKYQPKNIEEIEANKESIGKIVNFIQNFKKQKKKALLIYGPTGSGKTSHVYVIAKELNLEVFELNASDFRDANSIHQKLGSAAQQQSLFSKGKVLLIDEVDGIAGQQDRGGLKELLNIIEESKFPMILTSESIELEKLASLQKKVELVAYIAVPNNRVFLLLKSICEKEHLKFEEQDLASITKNARGDIRAALLDLEYSVFKGRVQSFDSDLRNKKEHTFQITDHLFKSTSLNDAVKILENVDDLIDLSKMKVQPLIYQNENMLMYLVEENIKDPAKFEMLSKADVVHGRIYRQQYWRLLAYLSSYLAFASVNQPIEKVRKVSRAPKNNFRLWGMMNRSRTQIAETLAPEVHASKAKVNTQIYPFYKQFAKQ